MKLSINVNDLSKQIEEAIKKYDGNYLELVKKFNIKLEKYLEFCKKQEANLKKSEKGEFKYPPTPPSWLRNNFEKTLTALDAHTESQIEMTSNEYSEIMQGIEQLQTSVTLSMNSYNSIDFE